MQPAQPSQRILLIEDDEIDAECVKRAVRGFKNVSYTLTHVATLRAGLAEIEHGSFDAVLLDLGLPDADDLDGLHDIRKAAAGLPVIVCSGQDCHDMALRAVQQGAQDYVIKSHVDSFVLARAVTYAIERKRTERMIENLAYHDALTGLPNRLLLEDRMRRAFAQAERSGERFALLYLDVDDFKNYNDTLGHAAGDVVIRTVAERLQMTTRATDTVSRLGGDEFVVLVEELHTPENAAIVAEKVHRVLSQPFDLEGAQTSISVSIGIAVWPEDGRTPEDLLKNADSAMYSAKRDGGAGHSYHSSALARLATGTLHDTEAMRRALAQHEFRLHYQPIIDLRAGKVAGVEALLRWFLPGGGSERPDLFIAAAEKNRMILPIGSWVVREAGRQSGAWKNAGVSPGRVCINVSPCELVQGNVPALVASVLSTHAGIELAVEVTEGSMMLNRRRAVAALEEIHSLGVQIAIDDFGMGNASLDHVRRLPFDILKVDRSFVADISLDASARAIVCGIISIAHGMGKEVVAEGVETRDQLDFLIEHGCDHAQGYYFSAAVAPERIAAEVRRVRDDPRLLDPSPGVAGLERAAPAGDHVRG